MQVDVRLLDRSAYGAALQYFTGSKEHNVALRDRAKRHGWKLNEYGLFHGRESSGQPHGRGNLRQARPPLDSPELRENLGEIEAAEKGELPKLVELGDIRGDLQMHTTASDGHASIEEMAGAAKQLGYQYILITDHSKAVTVANGLDEKRAVEHIRAHSRRAQKGEGHRNLGGLGSGHHGRRQPGLSRRTLEAI